MIFRGLLRQISSNLELGLTIFINGWCYILPFLLLIVAPYKISSNTYLKSVKVLILVLSLYVMLHILPMSVAYGNISCFPIGVKKYFLCLVYFSILYYLIENKHDFVERFLWHIYFIGLTYGIVVIYEFISMRYFPGSGLYTFFKSLSLNPGYRDLGIKRPLGLYFGMAYSGLLFAALAAYTLNNRTIKTRQRSISLFTFFVACTFLTTSKTYTLALAILVTGSILSRLSSKRSIYAATSLLLGLFIIVTIKPQYQHRYQNYYDRVVADLIDDKNMYG